MVVQLYEYSLEDVHGTLWYGASVGNSFTIGTVGPNEDFYIKNISVELGKQGTPPEPLYFSLYKAGVDGKPVGNVLSSGTLYNVVVGIFSWYNVSMSEYKLENSEKYIFLIRAVGGDISNRYIIKFDENPYAGGEMITYDGVDYILYPEYDNAFKIWGEPVTEGFLDITGVTTPTEAHTGDLINFTVHTQNTGIDDDFRVEIIGGLTDSQEFPLGDELTKDISNSFIMPNTDITTTINTYHWVEPLEPWIYLGSFTVGNFGAGNRPRGICTDGNYIWVVLEGLIYYNDPIEKYSMDGNYISGRFTGSPGQTDANNCTTDGNYIWVSDNDGTIYVYDINGLDIPSKNFIGDNRGICTDGNYIWTLSEFQIHKRTMDGISTGTSFLIMEEHYYPRDITTDGNYFWIIANNTVHKYNMDGTYTGIFGDIEIFGECESITTYGDYIWVADYINKVVYIYTKF